MTSDNQNSDPLGKADAGSGKSSEPDAKNPTPAPDSGLTGGEDDKKAGSTKIDPTRYGDWEKNGRCIDF